MYTLSILALISALAFAALLPTMIGLIRMEAAMIASGVPTYVNVDWRDTIIGEESKQPFGVGIFVRSVRSVDITTLQSIALGYVIWAAALAMASPVKDINNDLSNAYGCTTQHLRLLLLHRQSCILVQHSTSQQQYSTCTTRALHFQPSFPHYFQERLMLIQLQLMSSILALHPCRERITSGIGLDLLVANFIFRHA
ncbi:hypothetical protein AMS68_002143 [Peltaster fructicola]|uniref:Amino acid permease/ SLC12A domain-containing protein n=1 Tax=Peltaster fructicola TaxID=286661 RepID=A0A6H0XPL4_9PEZI|nr:hypothetical protein AMS68_002143 [Peltaster fructicola]